MTNPKGPPPVINGLTPEEQRARIENMILKNAEAIRRRRKEQRAARTERQKQIAAEKALRVLQRLFEKCKTCDMMKLRDPKGPCPK